MASMTGRSPDVPGIIPNISRSVVDRSRSGWASVPPMAPTTVIGTVRPRVGGVAKKASIAGGIF